MRDTTAEKPQAGLRRIVLIVAALNLAYFGVEFTVAQTIKSVSLFADSIDFLEDAAVNILISFALGWSATQRSATGFVLAALLLVPGVATLWTGWQKLFDPVAPAVLPLCLTGVGALAINMSCALMLMRHRHHRGGLMLAAFLSARNDALANIAIIAAAGVTLATHKAWPDLAVGIGITALNANAALAVFHAARRQSEA